MATACPTPEKLWFATQTEADDAAAKLEERYGSPQYPYDDCPCRRWHLTSTPPVEPEEPRTEALELLESYDDAAFAEVVRREAHGRAHAQEAGALRHPRLVARWEQALANALNDVQAQFRDRAGDRSPQTAEWRMRASWSQARLAHRRKEAKRLRHAATGRDAADAAQILEGRARVKELRRQAGQVAIQRLIDAHGVEFAAYVAEECERLGVDVPDRVRKHLPAPEIGAAA